MKILLITPKIPYPPTDGHKKSMWGVIKYMSLLGHQIDLVSYRQNDDPELFRNEIEKYAKLLVINVQTGNSITGAVKNIFSSVPYNLSKYNRPELKLFLQKYFNKGKVDLVHVFNSHMGWTIDIIREYTDAPVVLRQENLEMMIMQRYYETQKNILLKIYSFVQFKKFIKYEPALCEKYDLCIMMSCEDEIILKEKNPRVKTIVISLGVEKDLLQNEKKELIPFSLVHIGSLKWYPNFDGFNWFVKDVFPSVIKKYPEVKLFVYGGGFPKNYSLPETVRNNIIIEGFVENIWEELRDKSLAVIPLRIGSGIRVKILEMLATGQNIITTSVGKEGIAVENEKELLVADSSRDFAEKILNFFEEKIDSNEMAELGKDFIRKNYLWENIAGKFESAYKNLINLKNNQ